MFQLCSEHYCNLAMNKQEIGSGHFEHIGPRHWCDCPDVEWEDKCLCNGPDSRGCGPVDAWKSFSTYLGTMGTFHLIFFKWNLALFYNISNMLWISDYSLFQQSNRSISLRPWSLISFPFLLVPLFMVHYYANSCGDMTSRESSHRGSLHNGVMQRL